MNDDQYADIRAALAANESEHADFKRRLQGHDELLKGQQNILVAMERQSSAIESMNGSMGRMEKKVDAIDDRVAAMEKEPAEKWKKISFEILKWAVLAVIAGVVGYILGGATVAP